MDVNWQDPREVSLHERLAATIQREYEDSITASGSVADPDHLGARAASEILRAALAIDADSYRHRMIGVWFRADPTPSPNIHIFCATCGVDEGQLHKDFCGRAGVLRRPDVEVTL